MTYLHEPVSRCTNYCYLEHENTTGLEAVQCGVRAADFGGVRQLGKESEHASLCRTACERG
jgi:hypothetical protein